MIYVLSQIIKYILTLFISVYAFSCFKVFRLANESARKYIYIRQNIYIFMIHTLSFVVIILKYQEFKYALFYLFTMIFLIFASVIYPIIYKKANRLILNNMCLLLSVGFIIHARLSFNHALRQFIIAVISVAIFILVPYIMSRGHFFSKFYLVYTIIGIAMLLMVLLFSRTVYGAKINLSILGISFQPSEIVKILFVFSMAGFLAKVKSIKDIFVTCIVAFIHIVILVFSKDLGCGIILFVVFISMIYVASSNILFLIAGIISGSLGGIIGYKLFPHVRVRVKAFTDPFGTIDNAGYQIGQSLFAIGTGGFFGLGITEGAPTKIPVVSADFIFSAIAEEFGVFFAVCLILISLSCFVMFMNISMNFANLFYKYVALGLAVLYGFQVFLTIGGVTKFIPLTGVTLPFVSYGGTSVMISILMFSIIEGLYIREMS